MSSHPENTSQTEIPQSELNALPENQIFRFLREEKNVSQRELAKRLKKPRPYLRKLEGTSWRNVSMGELFDIAEALYASPEDLMQRLRALGDQKIAVGRCSVDQPEATRSLEDGVEYRLLAGHPGKKISFGILQIHPHKTASLDWVSKGTLFSMLVLKGQSTVEVCGHHLVFREKDFLKPDYYIPKQFYNSDSMKLFLALVITISL